MLHINIVDTSLSYFLANWTIKEESICMEVKAGLVALIELLVNSTKQLYGNRTAE